MRPGTRAKRQSIRQRREARGSVVAPTYPRARSSGILSGRHAAAPGLLPMDTASGRMQEHRGRGRALSAGRSDGRRRRHGEGVQGGRTRRSAGALAIKLLKSHLLTDDEYRVQFARRRAPASSPPSYRVRRGRGGQPPVPRDGMGGRTRARRRAEAERGSPHGQMGRSTLARSITRTARASSIAGTSSTRRRHAGQGLAG